MGEEDYCTETKKKRDLAIKPPAYFYNAHAHAFTLDQVPDGFLTIGLITLPLRWLRYSLIRKLTKRNAAAVAHLRLISTIGKILGFFLKFPGLSFLKGLNENTIGKIERMINLLKHGDKASQKDIVDNLISYYPTKTKFIILPMDMENMGAGLPKVRYYLAANSSCQIKELANLKNTKEYQDIIYPFIFAEPKRMAEDVDGYVAYFKENLSNKTFAGIKAYPALGYWPFDKRLMETYDYALQNNIPIMTHCVRGVVYNRKPEIEDQHPITGEELPGKWAMQRTTHYTNPLNYHFLMQESLLKRSWGEDAKDYSKLKVCLAHYGGAEEWNFYLDNPWHLDDTSDDSGTKYSSLLEKNWQFELGPKQKKHGWFSIISEMIRMYDNVYADISFTLHDSKILPLLKMILETNEKLRRRVLFGTDFYVVSQHASERRLSIELRSYLGEDLFNQIAYCNVEEYLSTDFRPKNQVD